MSLTSCSSTVNEARSRFACTFSQLDAPDGLLLYVTGCTHLKGGEKAYLQEIVSRLKTAGYDVRPAIADTIGAAARFEKLDVVFLAFIYFAFIVEALR